MNKPTNQNDKRFDVIIKTLDSCDSIQQQLNNFDQLNSSINETHLVNLINYASDLKLLIESNPFYQNKNLTQLKDDQIETIIRLIQKLDEYIDDNSKFNEAIILLEYIDQLYKRYGHEVTIIENIYKRSQKQRDRLVSNLCYKLEHLEKENSSKDEVRSIVNNLIKCGNFTDRDLKLKYLEARDNWFNNACEEKSASFDDVVSIYCNGLPMIFQEYKNIFNDSCEIFSNKLVKLSTSDPAKEDGAIINSWLLLKASIFIASLEVYLKTIDSSGIRTPMMIVDTMTKCFELTDWLSSIGFNFSSQLKPLFHTALMKEVKSSIDKATLKFETSFTTIAMKSIESLLLPIEDNILLIPNLLDPQNALPKSIENYPIFKIYCLDIVESLRWLQTTSKTLSPINLCLDTYASLNASMTRVMKALAIIMNVDNNSSHPILSKIALSFVAEVLPFFVNYCERLFPEKVILSAVGLTKAEFRHLCSNEPEKVKNFRLDLGQISQPLKLQFG